MKIIIAGDGKVGASLTKQLSSEGYDITLIDTNGSVLEKTEEIFDVMVVQGNCASMDTLLQAGVMEADLLIATTNADELNLLCCMTAHGMNADIHTIARIRNPEYTNQIYSMRDVFALSLVVNPEKQTAIEIERQLRYPGFLKRDTFAKGRVEIVELKIDEDSVLNNVKLSEISRIIKTKLLVCAVLRDGRAEVPGGEFILKSGDKIFVTASAEQIEILLDSMNISRRKIKNVIICGGGKVSVYLAQILHKKKINIKIIENQYSRCLELAELLPYSSIIHGDASDEVLLRKEGIENTDALISMTGVDELNMIVSLYGKQCANLKVITKLSHVDNNRILERLDIGNVINPKELCSNTIVRYVRAMKKQSGAAVSVHTIAEGHMEALEFRLDDSAKHLNEPLKNVKLKKNTLIASISKSGQHILPDGDVALSQGDTVVVVVTKDTAIHEFNDIFV